MMKVTKCGVVDQKTHEFKERETKYILKLKCLVGQSAFFVAEQIKTLLLLQLAELTHIDFNIG